ncbi:MAG: sensor histidine kinase [Spirochaetaceae bacterium]|nr:MAG: sensor histidine kinase [Spirochaetaceae bacterium]
MIHTRQTRRFRDFSLRTKLLVCLFAFIIGPLLVATVLINYQLGIAETQTAYQEQLNTLKGSEAGLANIVAETEFLSLNILSDETVQDLSRYYDTMSYTDIERRRASLFVFSLPTLLRYKPYITSVSLSRHGEVMFQYAQASQTDALVYREDTSISAQAYALEGRGFWTPAYALQNRIREAGPRYVISFIRAIMDIYTYGEYTAIQRISLDEAVFSTYYSNLSTSTDTITMIVDGSGGIVSSTDKSLLANSMSVEPFIQEVLQSDEGFFPLHYGGNAYVAFHYTIANPGWHVVQLVRRSSFSGERTIINKFVSFSIAICILFGILFSWVQNRSMINPLRMLEEQMQKVKLGDFDVQISSSSEDEIGRLCHLFTDMASTVKELIDRVYKKELRAKEAQLIALQAQINPHFLYNTLDSIYWLAYRNKDHKVAAQIAALSSVFRQALSSDDRLTTIRNELENLKSYMVIQDGLVGDRIKMELDVPEELKEYQTMKLVLQPLVENSITHGLERKIEGGTITVRIAKSGDDIRFIVRDDGLGTDGTQISKILDGLIETEGALALRNLHDRVRLQYGPQYGVRFESAKGKGTTVVVRIPAMTLVQEEDMALGTDVSPIVTFESERS